MQLRALQMLAQQPGNTLVLGMHPGATPIPLRERAEAELPPPPSRPRATEKPSVSSFLRVRVPCPRSIRHQTADVAIHIEEEPR